MSSPEPSGYPHPHPPHPHPHHHQQQQQQQPHQSHHLYGHHPDHHHHRQLPPVVALPPPPAPPHHLHQGVSGHEGYGERSYHYPERQSPFPPPPPPPPPPTLASHPPAPSHPEPEQPLDLSVSRSPRPSSAGTQDEAGPPGKRPRLEEGSRGEVELGRGDHHHSSVCLVRGCNCRSPMPLQHTPHYSQHRHSPYPQYPVSGHSSPAMPGEVHPYPHPYCISQPSPPSSSPGMLYGGGGGGSSSPYIPPPDRRSHSPGVGMVSYGEMAMSQKPPSGSGSLLGPSPTHSTISPLSVSTHVRDPSPCPPSQPLSRMRDVSPRPFYRPFEDPGHALADMPHAAPVITSSSRMGAMEPYPSEDDLSASSTLLMLSNTTSESRPTVLTRQTADSSADTFKRREHALRREETRAAHAEPSQSDWGRAGVFHHTSSRPTLPSYVPKALPSDSQHLGSREARSEPYPPENQPLGPAQDGTVASTYSSDDLNDSPAPPKHGDKKSKSRLTRTDSSSPKQEEKSKNLQSRLVKVVGTTPLAAMREQRARKHAEKVKELLEHRSGDGYSASSNDSEGASDLNSSGQASPRSSDGSDNDVGQGFPIPPDPNIKMSALDYLISKVLVERIDVPFKACNTEIQEIYTGAKKGRLTLVDLIELQVEASLKA